jgi:Alpha-galactosidases/6-phospho-beta-glucosidases, family 4 of glycosyl hydrolases
MLRSALKYTNPMFVLTNVFNKVSRLETVGLCCVLLGIYDILALQP